MDEVDQLLRAAGSRWRASQPAPAMIHPASLTAASTRDGVGRIVLSFVAGAAGAFVVLLVGGIVMFSIWAARVDAPGMVGAAPTATAVSSPGGTGDAGCVVTRPIPAFSAPSPYPSSPPDERKAWFGTPELLTMRELDGEIWDVPNASSPLSLKTFWWSSEWAGMRLEEQPAITVVATRLDGPGSVTADGGTNAEAESLGGEAMLVGLEVPPGCWQLTAEYRGAVLSYVIWLDNR